MAYLEPSTSECIWKALGVTLDTNGIYGICTFTYYKDLLLTTFPCNLLSHTHV